MESGQRILLPELYTAKRDLPAVGETGVVDITIDSTATVSSNSQTYVERMSCYTGMLAELLVGSVHSIWHHSSESGSLVRD